MSSSDKYDYEDLATLLELPNDYDWYEPSLVAEEYSNYSNWTHEHMKGACGYYQSTEFNNIWTSFSFWFEGVLMLPIGVLGLLGNTISIYVLCSDDMRLYPFHHLLLCLSSCDLFFLFCSLPQHIFPVLHSWLHYISTTQSYCLALRFVLYPFSNVAYTAAIFVMMAITFERYQSVSHPLRYRDALAESTPAKRALRFIAPALTLAILLNIPKFFEVQIIDDNGTFTCKASALKLDVYFIKHLTNSYLFHPLLTTTFIPIGGLCIMNGIIAYAIIKNRKSQTSAPSATNLQVQKETKLLVVLVLICVVYTVTHIPRSFLVIKAFMLVDNTTECALHGLHFIPSLPVVCTETVSNLLIHLNASVNFLIYSCTSAQFNGAFRRRLPWLLCRRGTSDQQLATEDAMRAADRRANGAYSTMGNTMALSAIRSSAVDMQNQNETLINECGKCASTVSQPAHPEPPPDTGK